MGDAGGVLGNGRDWELWMERHAGASRQQTQPITARADQTNSPTVSGRSLDMCRTAHRTAPNPSTDYVSQTITVHSHNGVLWTEDALKRRQILSDEERQALLGVPQDADSLARLFTLSHSDRHLIAERLSD